MQKRGTKLTPKLCSLVGWSITQSFEDLYGARVGLLGHVQIVFVSIKHIGKIHKSIIIKSKSLSRDKRLPNTADMMDTSHVICFG